MSVCVAVAAAVVAVAAAVVAAVAAVKDSNTFYDESTIRQND